MYIVQPSEQCHLVSTAARVEDQAGVVQAQFKKAHHDCDGDGFL